MQLLVPNGLWPYSWVVLLSVELHVKQVLQCSVLQLNVNNTILPVCSEHEKHPSLCAVCLLECPDSTSTGKCNQGTWLPKDLLSVFCKKVNIHNVRKWEIKGWQYMKNWLSELLSRGRNGSSFVNLFSPLINTARHHFVLKTNVCSSFSKGKKRKKERKCFVSQRHHMYHMLQLLW